jgi:voltage-gated potassium channel
METKLEKYKSNSTWLLSILSLAYLYIFCAINLHFEIADRNSAIFNLISNVIWILFAMDYVIMLLLSQDRIKFIKMHIPHLIVVLVPFLRILRIGLLMLLIIETLGKLKNKVLISLPIFSFLTTILFLVIGASAVYDAEYRVENANIKSRQDAFWWAAVTIFTVGYGDKFPITGEGRMYGVLLMFCGITIVGTVTATFAGWIVSQIRDIESENEKIIAKLESLDHKVSKLSK